MSIGDTCVFFIVIGHPQHQAIIFYLYIKQVYYCHTHSHDEHLRTYHYRIIFHIIEFDLALVLYYNHIYIKIIPVP